MTPYTLSEPHITEWSKRGWANNFYAKYPPHDADITISLFTTEMMDAAYQAGVVSRDGEIEALRADAAKWRVFVKRVNSPPSPTHNQWKLVEVCSMYGDEKELIYWEQIVADIAAEGKTP